MAMPCAITTPPNQTIIPPLFFCLYVGASSEFSSPAIHAHAEGLKVDSITVGIRTFLRCPLPSLVEVIQITGSTSGESVNASLQIRHFARHGPTSRLLPFAGLPEGDRLFFHNLPMPPSSPPSSPPASPPLPPVPPPHPPPPHPPPPHPPPPPPPSNPVQLTPSNCNTNSAHGGRPDICAPLQANRNSRMTPPQPPPPHANPWCDNLAHLTPHLPIDPRWLPKGLPGGVGRLGNKWYLRGSVDQLFTGKPARDATSKHPTHTTPSLRVVNTGQSSVKTITKFTYTQRAHPTDTGSSMTVSYSKPGSQDSRTINFSCKTQDCNVSRPSPCPR